APQGFDHPASGDGHVACGTPVLLARIQVQIRQREVCRAFAPYLDACERVQVQLQTGERVVARGPLPGLVIDDLPRTVDRSVDRVDPPAHHEVLQVQQERTLG